MNEKLNPLTCDLQVGDKVEVLSSSMNVKQGEIAVIEDIDSSFAPYLLRTKLGGTRCWRRRENIRLISRNGKPIEAEQHVEESKQKTENRVFVNVYDNGNGRFLSNDYASFDEAYENRADISTYIETVEIIRHEKPVPKIDFAKAGLILANDTYIVVTKGSSYGISFFANCIGTKKDGEFWVDDNWRDITAEAQPILEQLKQLMNGK